MNGFQKFDIEKAKTMTQNEVQAMVCLGLSEVAESLGFGELKAEFEAFGRIFLSLDEMQANEMRKKAHLINRTDKVWRRLTKLEKEMKDSRPKE